MSRVATISVVLLSGIVLLGAGAGSLKISGRVLDYKSRKDQPIGIPGVFVEAYDAENKFICKALTDGDGEYILEGLELGQEVTIRHRRIGYLRDPEVWRGAVKGEDIVIYMGRRNADQVYYQEIGEAIAERAASRDAAGLSWGWTPEILNTQVLVHQWGTFVQLGVAPEQKRAARAALLYSKPDYLLLSALLSETLMMIEADVIASQVVSLSSDAATEIVQKEGFISDIYFEFDDATLSGDAKEKLLATAKFLQASSFDLDIEGHSDELGTNEYNMSLSGRRASAVREYLIGLGVNETRARTIAYGEQHPACTEASEACYSQNRKAQLRLREKG